MPRLALNKDGARPYSAAPRITTNHGRKTPTMSNETPRSQTIVVVGGGIAGITAALEAAEMGAGFSNQVQHLRFSMKASAGVL